ncbi:MAG: HNH endonuclease [Myxococcota bacterium]|nr:HNH endonuclease [Myxococcota bacterium]
MTTATSTLLNQISAIRVWQTGKARAPHKPLLLLAVLGRIQRGITGLHPFAELEEAVAPVLEDHAPTQTTKPQVRHPFWYLRSDGLWEIPNADAMELQVGGFPKAAAFGSAQGRLPRSIEQVLIGDPNLLEQAVHRLLCEHFPETLHADLRQRLGLAEAGLITAPTDHLSVGESAPAYRVARRDPNFRRKVLQAYEHRCAVSGFRAALDGRYFGVEAAHVHWHAHGGPDQIDNGLALNPLLHLLFDRGAWSLTDDLRIIVSSRVTGDDETTKNLRAHHGKKLSEPLPGYAKPNRQFIHWHREGAGGVFRAPALGL